ncbi:MAG: diaminopropionate ammonia-lyase [Longimicrobiales bacterium]
MRIARNPGALRGPYPTELQSIISLPDQQAARTVIETWPGYTPSPLFELPRTAEELGLGRLWLKDESPRFGLGAFKSIGGAYAVYQLLADHVRAAQPQADVSPAAFFQGMHRARTAQITVACASAGNHGRAVAWGANVFGARCIVYLYQGVSAGRRRAIEALGASVDVSAPDYDTAVHRVARAAAQHGWSIISDTAYPGYVSVPRTVMHGYTVIAQETLEQLGDDRPTHIILQAGVGGFAAALAAHFWATLGSQRPVTMTVEPTGAACVLESLAARERVTLSDVDSIMGGLCCGEVSLLAWEILQRAIDYAVAIPDETTIRAMRRLARALSGEPRIVAGESGAAGFAALLALTESAPGAHDPGLADLGPHANVLIFSTEGATDPDAWTHYTGSALEDR